MKYLYVVGQGIGNMIETVYAYEKLQEHFGNVDVCYNHRTNIDGGLEKAEFYRVVAEHHGQQLFIANDYAMEPGAEKQYDGQITSVWVQPIKDIPVKAEPFGNYTNEVTRNNTVLKRLGIQDDPSAGMSGYSLDWLKYRGKTPAETPCYDLVVNNGSFKAVKWLRKRYRHWGKVIGMLDSNTLRASVGHPDEAIPGTEDLTGLGLLETMDVIANSRLFIGNDSGLYHFASVCGVRTIVMFTATNVRKNWNKDFHRTAYPLHSHLKCQPCQVDTWGWSAEFHRCTDYKCCDYAPELFIRYINSELEMARCQ